ncbi:9500_t:CDS:2 [Funneliformis geosporum]|uniref:9500_t:CDS:1 n=1 Tax=Funneliformis geosporum TaxID=1117311 RepID=A0A9W4WU26_9GLOM|nr:9500_t:CDS:2 [Funneliformis geosporum]
METEKNSTQEYKMIPKLSRPVYIFEKSPVALILPQEILCEIFSYLGKHPVHFTRVAQVCRTWHFAAENHTYWRRLIRSLELPDPKPRAYKYKTYKSVIIKSWGKFCTLCHMRKTRSNGYHIKPVFVDMVKIDKIDFRASTWFNVVLNEVKNSASLVNNDGKDQIQVVKREETSRFLKHRLCCRCNSIYSRLIREEGINERRKLLSSILEKFGLTYRRDNVQCDRFVFYGEGDPTKIAQQQFMSISTKAILKIREL